MCDVQGRSPIQFHQLPGDSENYFASRADLNFVALSYDLLEGIASATGLRVNSVMFGNWRGIGSRGAYDISILQDCLLIREPIERVLRDDFDSATYLALNPDVASR